MWKPQKIFKHNSWKESQCTGLWGGSVSWSVVCKGIFENVQVYGILSFNQNISLIYFFIFPVIIIHALKVWCYDWGGYPEKSQSCVPQIEMPDWDRHHNRLYTWASIRSSRFLLLFCMSQWEQAVSLDGRHARDSEVTGALHGARVGRSLTPTYMDITLV